MQLSDHLRILRKDADEEDSDEDCIEPTDKGGSDADDEELVVAKANLRAETLTQRQVEAENQSNLLDESGTGEVEADEAIGGNKPAPEEVGCYIHNYYHTRGMSRPKIITKHMTTKI